MTKKQFVEKYKGAFPDPNGNSLWKSWDELKEEMFNDLNEVIKDDSRVVRDEKVVNYLIDFPHSNLMEIGEFIVDLYEL
jgi:hypothetical protein